jgi:two-component system response regulator RegX3
MSGRVLVIEPEQPSSGRIADVLRTEGLVVEELSDGRRGLARALGRGYELVIVDPDAPGLEGWRGCERLRRQSDVPLMIVSARYSEGDRLRGCDAGADDYLDASFSTAELLSRVHALLRRRQLDLRSPTARVGIGDLELDKVTRTITVAGVPVSVTPTEFRLLALLAEQPGRTYDARQIMRALWQGHRAPNSGTCKAHISKLRQKLERDPSNPERIVTVRGVGYRLLAVWAGCPAGAISPEPRAIRGAATTTWREGPS